MAQRGRKWVYARVCVKKRKYEYKERGRVNQRVTARVTEICGNYSTNVRHDWNYTHCASDFGNICSIPMHSYIIINIWYVQSVNAPTEME